jgi:Mg-chelatase subunit ChlI
MKTGGQVTDRLEPDSDSQAEDEDEDDGYDDTNTLSIRTLASFDEGKLKDALQDRFAELVSNRKNGEYVAATLLAESPDKLAIIVARNEGFSNDDRKFMRKIESLLRNIARGISK